MGPGVGMRVALSSEAADGASCYGITTQSVLACPVCADVGRIAFGVAEYTLWIGARVERIEAVVGLLDVVLGRKLRRQRGGKRVLGALRRRFRRASNSDKCDHRQNGALGDCSDAPS